MSNQFEIPLPPIESDPQTWIDLLVDNELSREQRRELLIFLDSHPALWQECGMSFINNQLIEAGIRQSVKPTRPDQVERKLSPLNQRHNPKSARLPFWLAIAAAVLFMIGYGTHWLTSHSTTNDGLASSAVYEQELSEIAATYQEVYEIAAEQQQRETTLRLEKDLTAIRSMASRNKVLIEVENSEERAVYYTQDPLPDFLLEALVLSGHQVQVKQKMLEVDGGRGKSFGYPIHEIEIKKFALLNLIQVRKDDGDEVD